MRGRFMCCECEFYYEAGITGDSDERTCYSCMSKAEETDQEEIESILKDKLNLPKTDTSFYDSVDIVIDYLWRDEEKNFYENDKPDDHIYRHLVKLRLQLFTNKKEGE